MPANTPNGLPYPLGTDRVMDGDDAIKALAQKVDDNVKAGIASGVVNPTMAGGLDGPGLVVTLPVGRFTVAPNVVACVSAGSSGLFITTTLASTTSFSVILHTRTAASGTFASTWVAVGV